MKHILAILFLPFLVFAGDLSITFVPQPKLLSALDQYQVIIANRGESSERVFGQAIFDKAFQAGISLVTYSNLQREIERANRRSFWHYASLGTEYGGQVATGLSAFDLIKIDETKWKGVIAGIAFGLPLLRGFIERESQPIELPNDLMPPIFTVAPGESVGYAVFAVPRSK